MIFGECPYCEEPVSTPLGPAPCVSKETCEHCGQHYFLKHSRLDPMAYPLDAFIVDEETKTLKPKD